jgi:plasmid stabilization system protein ParE
MKRPYRLSREAKTDLLQIWNYLAESASFDVADKVVADLKKGMDQLGKSPGIGHYRTDITELPIKFYRVHRYLILYTPDLKPIGIVRILHGARDISFIMSSAPF